MPKFNVTIPHSLTQDEAKERLNRFTETVGASSQVSDLEQSWDGNDLQFGFKSYGIKLSGTASIGEEKLDVVGDMPFAAMMFKGKIESEIKKVMGKLLGQA